MTDLSRLKRLTQWPELRSEIETRVLGVIGKLNKPKVEPQVKTMDEIEFPGFVRRRINYFVDDWERVSAWLFLPEGREEFPAILCCHQMCPQGKDESAGIDGSPTLAFARHYAERGYVTLAPDCLCAGDRVAANSQPYDTKAFYKSNSKSSIVAKMLCDHMRCIDVLRELRQVDPARMAVIGHDMGGYNALFLVAFDPRVQVCVASGAFTAFCADDNPGRWASGSGLVLLPALREAVEKREFPFDWEHILALIAPSPTLLITALNDEVLPNTTSCEKAVGTARKIYKLLGAENALSNYSHRAGHRMTAATVEVADDWFERWL